MAVAAQINPNQAGQKVLGQLAQKQAQATGIQGWKAVDSTSSLATKVVGKLKDISSHLATALTGKGSVQAAAPATSTVASVKTATLPAALEPFFASLQGSTNLAQAATTLSLVQLSSLSKMSAEEINAKTPAPLSDTSIALLKETAANLAHFGESLSVNGDSKAFDSLPSDLKGQLGQVYENGLNRHDPMATAFLGRMGQMIADTQFDSGFIKSTVTDLVKGDYSSLVRVQEHMADVSTAKVTTSAQFDSTVLNLALRGAKTEGDQSKISTQHALRIAKRVLGEVLGPDLGINKMSDFKFDERTLGALSKHTQFHSKAANVILGKVIMLEHEMAPSGDLQAKFSQVGISMTPAQINTYFGQGLHNTQAHDFALMAITQFSQKLSAQLKGQSLLKGVMTSDVSSTTRDFGQKIMAKMLGMEGASTEQLSVMEPQLGGKLAIVDDTSARAKLGAVFGGGSGTVASALNQVNTMQSQVFQLKLNVDAIKDPKLKAETNAKLDKLNSKIDQLLSAHAKPLANLNSLIRLSIARVFSEHGGDEAVLGRIQDGTTHALVMAELAKLGVTQSSLSSLNLDSPRPLDALISRESSQFKGQASLTQWLGDIKLDSSHKTITKAKNFMEAHPEIHASTGQEPAMTTQAKDWISGLKSGEQFAMKWGAMNKLSSTDQLAMAQAGLLGSLSATTTAQTDRSKLLVVQNESVGDTSRFSITISKELGASMGIELGALAGMVTATGTAGASGHHGIKLMFPSIEAASLTLGSMMSNRMDAATLGNASAILPLGGYQISVGGSLYAGFSLTDVVGGVGNATGGASPVDPSIGTFSVELSAGKDRKVTQQENRFEQKIIHESGLQASLTLTALGKEQQISYTSTTTSESHFIHHSLTSTTQTSQVQIQTQGSVSNTPIATQKAFDLASPISLSMLEKTDPAVHAQVKELLGSITAGDHLQVTVSLPPEIVVKANELADPASAKYDPKAAKALVSDPKSYTLTSVKIMRSVEVNAQQSVSMGAMARQNYRQASFLGVVSERSFG